MSLLLPRRTAGSDPELDVVFTALAHPIRRRILSRLAAGEEPSVSELAEPFGVTLMAVSKHVKVLEAAGLLEKRAEGRERRCRFLPAGMVEAADWMEAHRRFWQDRLGALAEYLEREPEEEDDG